MILKYDFKLLIVYTCYRTIVISIDSVFLLIDIITLKIILLFMNKEGLLLKKIIKYLKILKKRSDIFIIENQLRVILEN